MARGKLLSAHLTLAKRRTGSTIPALPNAGQTSFTELDLELETNVVSALGFLPAKLAAQSLGMTTESLMNVWRDGFIDAYESRTGGVFFQLPDLKQYALHHLKQKRAAPAQALAAKRRKRTAVAATANAASSETQSSP